MSRASARAAVQPGKWGPLAAALLDFQAFPGRYATALREPRPLFEHATEVLLLAAGRAVEGLPEDAELQGRLRAAARFFVRMAMLRQGADHYTLLGVAQGFEPATLREHYRILMRLTHPDFAGGRTAWPADAATRINLANDVLASPERRQAYDQSMPPKPRRGAAGLLPVATVRRFDTLAPRRRRWPAAVAGAALVGLVAAWLFPGEAPHEGEVHLAQAPALDEVADAAREPSSNLNPSPIPIRESKLDAGPVSTASVPPVPASEFPHLERRMPFTPASSPVVASRAVPLQRPDGPSRAAPTPATPVAHVQRAPDVAETGAPVFLEAAMVAQGPAELAAVERPRMKDVQPLLGQLLGALQSGRGEQAIRLVDRSARHGDGDARFVDVYNRVVSGARGVKLGPVQFAGRNGGDHLVVDGVVQLQLQDDGMQPSNRELVLRALFAMRGGQTVMTQLSASETGR